MTTAPELLTTRRLLLRHPREEDAEAIFDGWARHPECARYMSWATHLSLDDTRAFLKFAREAWARDGVGTYLIERGGLVIGSTGLHPHHAGVVETGYVLRPDAWGHGYATEACRAMIDLGRTLGLARVQACCHVEHAASARVLEKAGMTFEGVLHRYQLLPNVASVPQDVKLYAAFW